jgi:hypothetical protein
MGNSHKRKTELDLTMSTQLKMEGFFSFIRGSRAEAPIGWSGVHFEP